MENPKLKDEKSLIEIFKVISWFDDKRWNQDIERTDSFVEEVLKTNELQPTQKILVHWLIYITNRGKRAGILWDKSTPKIKELVVRYFSKDVLKKEQVTKLCEKYERENKIQAFPADLESINKTLILLLDYDKDIINFMTKRLSEWEMEYPENFCPRIAFSLYLLSYRDVGSLAKSKVLREQNKDELNEKTEKARDILNDENTFENEFQKSWYKNDKRWHKRIWAALRDCKKFSLLSEIFIKGIKIKANQDVWRKDFTEQLELPGDIWNIRFFRNCIEPIAKNIGIKGKNAPKIVRNLWERIKSKCPGSYPEQFDITFDFASRMCNMKLCDLCPFGRNGAESICIPNKDKYCPVALISCGYIIKCSANQGKCIIKEGIGKGKCKGVLK